MKHRKGKWKAKEPVETSARRELPLFAEEYFAEGRKAVKRGSSAETLHGFRLSTKHLRYLMELFRPLYGPRMDTLLEQLKHVQTLLGELNDYAVTREMLADGADAGHPDTRQLLRHLTKQERTKKTEFRKYWAEEFDGDRQEEQWMQYLSRVAGKKGANRAEPVTPSAKTKASS
jgi:CHAD domain-containing protein